MERTVGCGHNSQSMYKSDLVSSSAIARVLLELCEIVSSTVVCSAHKQSSAFELKYCNEKKEEEKPLLLNLRKMCV